MRFRTLAIGAALFGSAHPVLADCNSTTTLRLCTNVYITRLTSSEDGSNSIQTSGNESALSCTATGGYLLVDMTAPYAASMYAHLLSLNLSGRMVSVRLSDHKSTCTVTYIYSDS